MTTSRPTVVMNVSWQNTSGDIRWASYSDATTRYATPLTNDRLFDWHASLFPTGRSGMHEVATGRYRDGPMQVVSGAIGRERVHYEAPPPERVPGLENCLYMVRISEVPGG